MFNAKQNRLLTTLGLVSDKERMDMYEAYCEVDCEMRANGMGGQSFTDWLEHKVNVALYIAKRNAEKSLKQMA
jgi:hypothetical protein